MPAFTFEAVNSQGQDVRGEIEARSAQEAAAKVRQAGNFPTKIVANAATAATGAVVGAARRKQALVFGGVSSKELTQFTRQFSTLIDAGLPIVRSLDILANQLRPGVLKNALVVIQEDVESGSSLSEAMAKHPSVFDKLFVNMVRAGEVGGVLDVILERLADFREKSQRLKRKIIGAMVYPVLVMLIASIILLAIMFFIIPKFEKIFKDMKLGNLPPLTQGLMTVTKVVTTYWYMLPGIPLALYILFKVIRSTASGRYAIDNVKLHLPVFGMIIRKSAISNFCRTLGTLISSGVPILDALSIIKNATGNEVVAKAVEQVHDSIREGDTIAGPLRNSGVFDDMVVNMIDVGEETGELDKMLVKIADIYDEEVDTLVVGLVAALEPALIIFMGVTVGTIVVALFMPLVKLIERVSENR